ncbi:MAG: hypothetical protein H7Y36_12750 [Armatimonadetes bacterium]|nr:hypothetical protein [Akkermansiaceae bacterium]
MKIDLPMLREEAKKNPTIAKILRACGMGRRSGVTSLTLIEKRLIKVLPPIEYGDLVVAFRTLESLGFGRLLQVTQRNRSRFAWTVDPMAVNGKLPNPGAKLLQGDLLAFGYKLGVILQKPEEAAKEDARPAGWIQHRLDLRPGKAVELLLPPDLTAKEADWIASFIHLQAERGRIKVK